jgi:hypothetical protein
MGVRTDAPARQEGVSRVLPPMLERRPEEVIGRLEAEGLAAMRRMRQRVVSPTQPAIVAEPPRRPLMGEPMGEWQRVGVKFGASARYRATPYGYQWEVTGPRGMKQGIGPFDAPMPLHEAAREVGNPMAGTIYFESIKPPIL